MRKNKNDEKPIIITDKILRQSACQLEGWNWTWEVPVEGDSSYVERNFYRLHNCFVAIARSQNQGNLKQLLQHQQPIFEEKFCFL
jgi:hypothetical protein